MSLSMAELLYLSDFKVLYNPNYESVILSQFVEMEVH